MLHCVLQVLGVVVAMVIGYEVMRRLVEGCQTLFVDGHLVHQALGEGERNGGEGGERGGGEDMKGGGGLGLTSQSTQ